MEEGDREKEKEELMARSYQTYLHEQCLKQNSIIFLPTGSGKTFISIQLMKRLQKDVQPPYSMGGKRTFFLVNSVALVDQQVRVIQLQTNLVARGYSSEEKVDYWKLEDWLEELEKVQVFVMTAQILSDMISHNYITLDRINLIIFDECHHAVDQHPMRLIMCKFNTVIPSQYPRILGLTATLLNKNVSPVRVYDEVRELEKTFNSKIASSESLEEVMEFSTNPTEKIFQFVPWPLVSAQYAARSILTNLQENIRCLQIDEKKTSNIKMYNASRLEDAPNKLKKYIMNCVDSMLRHFEELGTYGGSMSILAHMVLMERLKLSVDIPIKSTALQVAITSLNRARGILEKHMAPDKGPKQILLHSSDKIQKLLNILKEYSPNVMESSKDLSVNKHKEKLCCIIFVNERFTCKILSAILKNASRLIPDLEYLKNDFVVGYNLDPFNDTREGFYAKKQNKLVMEQFVTSQLNCLVSTQVLEEGIDIPRCTLVVRFDPIHNFRSYVQAKGRGRHTKAVYVMLVENKDYNKFVNDKYEQFKKVETILNNEFYGRNDKRTKPSNEELLEKYKQSCIPYVYKNASVTMDSAISLMNRYCSTLPQDKFTVLQPEWYQHHDSDQTLVSVLLPTKCPIKDPIKGIPMRNLKNAKKSAALNACKQLHLVGELNDNLLPIDRNLEVFDDSVEKKYFAHWVEEEEEKDMKENRAMDEPDKTKKSPRPGTKAKKRVYTKKIPKVLCGSGTKELTYYMHWLDLTPVVVSGAPIDENNAILHDLLRQPRGFCLLTVQALPDICNFSLYMGSGEVTVNIINNVKKVILTHQQFEEIKRFHILLFGEVLGLEKSFMAFDSSFGPNFYFSAPAMWTGECLQLDWNTIQSHHSLEPLVEPSLANRRATNTDPDYYRCSVVAPWYRSGTNATKYIVTKVCEYMTPMHPFCNTNYTSYADYFKKKYYLSLHGSQDQPMLQVKYLSGKMNALLPRSITLAESGTSSAKYRRKLDGGESNFDEHLVPEFCVRFSFPGLLWFKATLLPSLLHRMTGLLQAEELRRIISLDAGLGCVDLPNEKKWEPMIIDIHALSHSQQAQIAKDKGDKKVQDEYMNVDETVTTPSSSTTMLKELRQEGNYRLAVKKLDEEFPWQVELEPIDMERNFDVISLMDIECYHKFVNQKLHDSPVHITPSRSTAKPSNPIKTARAICPPPFVHTENIELLSRRPDNIGPQLRHVLEAITAAKSNDIINMERLETLGDSFLKFSVSLHLLHTFPKYDEGRLTQLKGRIVSNRNLYYCGVRKELPGRLMVHQFSAKADWITPAVSVPKPLQDLIIAQEVCPSVLYCLQMIKEEILNGEMSRESFNRLEEAITNWLEDSTMRRVEGMEPFLNQVIVQDKVVADSIEALIGAYIQHGGIISGLKLLKWLKVLPNEKCEDLLNAHVSASSLSQNVPLTDIAFQLDYTIPEIEKILGYKFKNQLYLLQALSHASNSRNRLTESYERLEFLGDAVLDFLVTCHIYERCGRLSPGQLTDLRSALVNNTTLACFTVRLQLYKFLQYSNATLDSAILKFVKMQNQKNHIINDSVLYLLQEDDCNLAEHVEVPKVLGDIFESLVGAVYLDCGGDLAVVWKVFYAIMHKEIALFSENVPVNPVRMLYEQIHATPHFLATKLLSNGMVMFPLQIRVLGRLKTVHGFGKNKSWAKRSAAKIALRLLEVC